MARNDSLSNYLQDVGNAIKEKLGTNEEILATDFDTRIREIKSGSDFSINGIIKEYRIAAGENVSAGDFVEFCQGYTNFCNSDYLIEDKYSGENLSAEILSDNRIFIAHSKCYGGDTTFCLAGALCKINENEKSINILSNVVLDSMSRSGVHIKTLLLENDRVAIFYDTDSTNDQDVYGMICSFANNNINIDCKSGSYCYSRPAYSMNAIKIKEGQIFFSTTRYNNFPLIGMLVNYSSTTLSFGTTVVLSTVERSGQSQIACLCGEDSVFIANGGNSAYYLWGMVCSCKNDVITAGNNIIIDNTANGIGNEGNIRLFKIKEEIGLLYRYTQDGICSQNVVYINVDNNANTFTATVPTIFLTSTTLTGWQFVEYIEPTSELLLIRNKVIR